MLTLIEIRDMAQEMGLESTLMNVGYPDPFLLLSLANPTIAYGDDEFVYSGLYLVFSHDRRSDPSIQWWVTQKIGNIAHPHMHGTSETYSESFCFGDNLNTITRFFRDGKIKLMIAFIQSVLPTYYSSSAYTALPGMKTTKGCWCNTGEASGSVCQQCSVKTIDGADLHFSAVKNIGTERELIYIDARSNEVMVECPECRRSTLEKHLVKNTISGLVGCQSCTVALRDGRREIKTKTRSVFSLFGGSEKIIVSRDDSYHCPECGRDVDARYPLCNKRSCPCPSRSAQAAQA